MAKSKGSNLMELNRRLISLIQSEPVLWDPNAYGYTTVAEKSNAWNKICAIVGLPSENIMFYFYFLFFF